MQDQPSEGTLSEETTSIPCRRHRLFQWISLSVAQDRKDSPWCSRPRMSAWCQQNGRAATYDRLYRSAKANGERPPPHRRRRRARSGDSSREPDSARAVFKPTGFSSCSPDEIRKREESYIHMWWFASREPVERSTTANAYPTINTGNFKFDQETTYVLCALFVYVWILEWKNNEHRARSKFFFRLKEISFCLAFCMCTYGRLFLHFIVLDVVYIW